MNLDRLREFAVLAEYGSFNAAADALQLAPSTLGARFHAFEDSLDARLLVAREGVLEPTEAGRILLSHARSILAVYRATAAAVATASRHAYRRLRIALAETSLPMFLGPFLDRINRTWPDVRIDLVNGSRLPLVESLLRGTVDLYCTLLMDDAVPEGLTEHCAALSPGAAAPGAHAGPAHQRIHPGAGRGVFHSFAQQRGALHPEFSADEPGCRRHSVPHL